MTISGEEKAVVSKKNSTAKKTTRKKATPKAKTTASSSGNKSSTQSSRNPRHPGEGRNLPQSGAEANATLNHAQLLGEIASLMIVDKAHKFMHVADLEWLIIPPLMLQQCRLFRANDPKTGKPRPVGAAVWAYVTPEISKRLEAGITKLAPNEWRAADPNDPNTIIWVVDVIAPFGNPDVFLKDLEETALKDKQFQVRVMTKDGRSDVQVRGK